MIWVHDEFDDDEYFICDECGCDPCICYDCPRCQGRGWVNAFDGYQQYLGDGTMRCPECGGSGQY